MDQPSGFAVSPPMGQHHIATMTRIAMLGALWALLCGLVALAPAGPAEAAVMEPLDHAVCRLIEHAAGANHLPVGFLTRVIWRESSFRVGVVSPAGAQGIAQFMPATAQERGLADPFDPEQAIPKAAHLLAELRRRFGSLGMAAAAYNAGPARVAGWLEGTGALPAVTRSYMRFVTQEGAEDVAVSGSSTPPPAQAALSASPQTCLAVTAELRRGHGGGEDVGFAPLAPWGVQLAGNFSKAMAMTAFERERQRYGAVIGQLRPMVIGRLLRSRGTRRFYQIRLPAASRSAADALCHRIQSAGGACVVLHS
ncbi:MAG: lytic transglycosylase domain-containing protein [Thiohalocapsa sp.]